MSIYLLYVAFRLCFIRSVLFFVVVLSGKPKQKQGRELVDCKLVEAIAASSLLAVPRRLFCFGSLFF